ncbi:LPD1 domain-containing protein [Leptospira levettii]|uniref:LPD1 domain-containing protein n=1 Tax=Leptospira levettii TaxID=2023178 RepID=UPI000C2A6550|nr:LPD1 domain-containing protein [Leptospira levettii]PJZ89539.1 hypothetical protein CH368_06160 [Leptospira levettii]
MKTSKLFLSILKGKKLDVGHISNRKDGKYQKQADGKWKRLPGKKEEKELKEEKKKKTSSSSETQNIKEKKNQEPTKKKGGKIQSDGYDSDISTDPNYRFGDVGYVAGSRKELAATYINRLAREGKMVASTQVDWESLEENPRVAEELITKKKVFGKVDWDELASKGYNKTMGYFLSKIYSVVPQKPMISGEEGRLFYVRAIENLRGRLESKTTLNGLLEELKLIDREGSDRRLLTAELQNELKENSEKRLNSFSQNRNSITSEESLALMHRNNEIIRIGEEAFKNSEIGKLVDVFGREFYKEIKGIFRQQGRLSKPYIIAKYDYEHRVPSTFAFTSKDTAQKTNQGKKDRKPVFNLLVADYHERIGGRKVEIKSTLDLKKKYGMANIQSGNWVLSDKASGEFHTRSTGEAFSDLADVLGIKDSDVSLNGTLSIAFGARGRGGKGSALAHYETSNRVINLTKISGGGALGHEWFHALDNIIGAKYGVNWKEFGTESYMSISNSKIREAFENLNHSMRFGEPREVSHEINLSDLSNEYVIKKDLPQDVQDRLWTTLNSNLQRVWGNQFDKMTFDQGVRHLADKFKIKSTIKRITESDNETRHLRNYKNFKSWLSLWKGYKTTIGEKLPEKVGFVYNTELSQFFIDARRLEPGAKSLKRYWSTTREMGARAFQSFVEDELTSKKRVNTYLVSKSSNKDYLFGHKPFPEGEERTKINDSFKKLITALKEEGAFEELKEFAKSFFGLDMIVKNSKRK